MTVIDNSNNMSDIRSSFSKSFTGDLVVPGDADYDASIARWASNAQRHAKVVAFVKSPEDVALALAVARSNKVATVLPWPAPAREEWSLTCPGT